MSPRATIEKEINDSRRTISALEKDVKQIRDWISQSERTLGGMTEALRRITEDSIARARAELADKENTLQRLRNDQAVNERLLNKITDIEKKEQEIARLESEQERIIALLERNRTELNQLKEDYEQMTGPEIVAQFELVLPNNQRISLDTTRHEYVIGWRDDKTRIIPDIDLGPLGGSSEGVSRRHATLRYDHGQWILIDLGSTNGTFVNDKQITPQAPTMLADKTTIRLGNIKVFFRQVTRTVRLTVPGA